MLGFITDFVSTLKVDPEIMKAKAEAVQVRITEMKVSFDEIENTLRKTQSYWIGEAGDAHRELFSKTGEEREEIFKRLAEDVNDLYTMAAQYTATENEIKQLTEELPSDVIV